MTGNSRVIVSSEEEEAEINIISNTDSNVFSKNKNKAEKAYQKHRQQYSVSSSTGWKKLLWLKQPYDDNYTDSSFLSQLKRNSTVVKYSYRKLVSDFSLVVLHLSLIMSVIVVFYGTYRLNWNPLKPAILSTTLTVAGFLFYVYLTEPSPPNFFETFKSSMLIILYLLTLSPVLKSLTNSTSSDSIWALSAWLSILNVMFNDYEIDFPKPVPKSNFSKNIAVSNAIVLASRLQSNASAFSFILFCIQACGLFPIFNNFTRRCDLQGFHYFQLTSIVLTVDVIVWYLFGLGWFIVWVSLHLMIVIVGPWYFLTLQKYKDELQGPWDPAKPILKSL
ncbi:hypothetical protein PICMEDRAFT_37134 [Pichia membranifaciens NRRL Y-2026]|uniref:Phosphatidylinositol N-acetylglucosaminyltransferase n=1 Tax=Pichia membranifaciens NRRL Y-2026 TaxID=763406 RepID=A0A1E3NED3_9ASCO|nr:hypothetical protein PICMEDRAFT_37134 [Pichia membranifaciens NRRL Y-2026]ODQ44456.1 hypothetical protein PICMEDRAFT_37134 [Pichia membranifaciens NRRL Y-2026]